MPLENRDAAHLWDMLDAAKTNQEFAADVSFDRFPLLMNSRKLTMPESNSRIKAAERVPWSAAVMAQRFWTNRSCDRNMGMLFS